MSGTWWGPQMDHAWTMVTHLNRCSGMIYGLKYKTSSLHLACPLTHHTTQTHTHTTPSHTCVCTGQQRMPVRYTVSLTLFCFTYLFSACIFTYSQTVFATPEEVCGRSLIAWLRETRRLKGLKREGRHLESGTSDVP